MEKKFGLITAISMVVGIVIGSGVFFKAVNVLQNCNGDMGKSLLVIAIVGLICIICSCVFAALGTKYARCNGIIDYAEVAGGPRYAFNVGWFMSTMYYPNLSAVLAFVSARYVSILLGYDEFGYFTIGLGSMFLITGAGINSLAPKLSGKLQVSMTVIKLVPLLFMGIIGTIIGLVNGNSISIFSDISQADEGGGFFAAICAFAFAYEGWIIATTINAELKNPKKDLPRALIIGAFLCTAIYMLYVYSMSATMNAQEILAAGNDLPRIAFSRLFHSNVAGTVVMVFIIVSCLGTMNGLIMGCMRGFYSVAVRCEGEVAKSVAEVDRHSGMPLKSCILGLFMCGLWYFQSSIFFFNGPLVTGLTGNAPWLLGWEADEIVIVTQYAFYIPIFLFLLIKGKEFSKLQRGLAGIGTLACVFVCACCIKSYGTLIWSYLIVFMIIMAIGNAFYRNEDEVILRKAA